MFAAKAFTITSFILAGAKALSVSTPNNVVQCGDTQITISGATGQYHVSVVPSVDPCAHDSLFESDALTGDSYTWKTKIPAGTQAMIVVDDAAGNEAWSDIFTVGNGDASCLNGSPSSSSYSSTSYSSTSSTLSESSTSSASGAYTPAPTLNVANNVPASASASSSHSVDAPENAQQGNTPTTSAALSNAHASLFTILVAMGVVAVAL